MNPIFSTWDRELGHAWGGPPWFGLIFVVLVIGLAGLAVYAARRRPEPAAAAGPAAGPAMPSAEQVLAARFARGDINEDEYVTRLSVLRGGAEPDA